MSIAFWIATLGGAGLVKRAPGTIGTMVSLLFWAPFIFFEASWAMRLFAAFLIFCTGLWAIQKSLTAFQSDDPQSIVIDEAAGMGITLCLCPPFWWNLVLGFALFRFFDIVKPWPVSWADQQIKGPLGIMLDDILAGLYALLVLFVLNLWLFP